MPKIFKAEFLVSSRGDDSYSSGCVMNSTAVKCGHENVSATILSNVSREE